MNTQKLKRLLLVATLCLTFVISVPQFLSPVQAQDAGQYVEQGREWAKQAEEIYRELTAHTHRSCNAYYELQFNNINGIPAANTLRMGNFSARRGCGRAVPNRCRRRARDSAHQCMKSHWYSKNALGDKTPEECQPIGGLNVQNYTLGNLDSAIQNRVCSFISGENAEANVAVYAITSGDKGCGPREAKSMRVQLAESHKVSCS